MQNSTLSVTAFESRRAFPKTQSGRKWHFTELLGSIGRVVGHPEVIRFIRHSGPLTAILPRFPGRVQLPIPLGLNHLRMPGACLQFSHLRQTISPCDRKPGGA